MDMLITVITQKRNTGITRRMFALLEAGSTSSDRRMCDIHVISADMIFLINHGEGADRDEQA